MLQPARDAQNVGSAEEQLERSVSEFIGIQIVEVLAKHHPEFLVHNPEIVQLLHQTWSCPAFAVNRFSPTTLLDSSRLAEPPRLLNCLLINARMQPGVLGAITPLLSAFSNRELAAIPALRLFIFNELPRLPLDTRQALMKAAVQLLSDVQAADATKSLLIDKVLIPIIFRATVHPAELSLLLLAATSKEPSFVAQVLGLVHQGAAELEDRLKLSYMQLVGVFCKLARSHASIRSELDKHAATLTRIVCDCVLPARGGWSNDDITVKCAGLLFASLSIDLLPSAFTDLQVFDVYEAVMTVKTSDHRAILSQAADIMLTLAQSRCAVPADNGQPKWASIIAKAFEAAPSQHLLPAVIGHQTALHPYRVHIYPWINKQIAYLSTGMTRPDMVSTAIDLAEMVIQWSATPKSGTASQTPTQPSTPRSASNDNTSDAGAGAYKDLHQFRESLVLVLFKMAVANHLTAPAAAERCLKLLVNTFNDKLWEPVLLALLSWFEKIFPSAAAAPTGAGALNIKLAMKVMQQLVLAGDQWLPRIGQMSPALCTLSACADPIIAAALRDFIGALLTKCPVATVSRSHAHPLSALYARFSQQFTTILATVDQQADLQVLHTSIGLFATFFDHNEQYAESYVNVFVKVLLRLQDLYASLDSGAQGVAPVTTAPATAPQSAPGGAPSRASQPAAPPATAQAMPSGAGTAANETPLDRSMLHVFRILASQAGTLDLASRKLLLSSINYFLDHAPHTNSILGIITIAEKWVAQTEGRHPVNTKDKALLLQSTMSACFKTFAKVPVVVQAFFALVGRVFAMPEYANSDLTQRLEVAFMSALRHNSAAVREEFFAIYARPLQAQPLFARFDYCFNECCQRWESSQQSFWIKQCLDLLLDGTSLPAALICAAGSAHVTVPAWKPSMDVDDADASTKLATLSRAVTAQTLQRSLRTLCAHSAALADELWVPVFVSLWNMLNDVTKKSLEGEIINLLQQDYLADQALVRPSSVKSLFTALVAANTSIAFSPALLVHLAKTHNLWHCCAEFIRGHLIRVQAEHTSEVSVEPYREALIKIYELLNEEGWCCAVNLLATLSRRLLVWHVADALKAARDGTGTGL